MRELAGALRRFEDMATNRSHASIRVEAGGAGVWIATTACLVMLGMMLVGGLWISREFGRIDAQMAEQARKIDDSQDYLSAIYQVAPQLKPEQTQ